MNNERIALTFGDAGENHVGNQMLGNRGLPGSGFTSSDLNIMKEHFNKLGFKCELINLGDDIMKAVEEGKLEHVNACDTDASVLIIREFVNHADSVELYGEVTDVVWDRKYYCTRRKRVLNKHARANLVFVDDLEQEPDYENKKGRIVDSKKLNVLSKVKNSLMDNVFTALKEGGSNTKHIDYICEGNRYFDLGKCGIGFHGDKERTRVLCLSVGVDDYPMKWVWFYKSRPITKVREVRLNNGDIYIMSEKTVGYDWSKRNTPTIRHAAGAYKYTNLDKY